MSAFVDIKDFNIQKVTQLMNAIITVLKLFNGRSEKCISEVRLRLTRHFKILIFYYITIVANASSHIL